MAQQGEGRHKRPFMRPLALRWVGERRPRRSQGRAAPGPSGGGKLSKGTHGASPGRGRSRWAGGCGMGWAPWRTGGRFLAGGSRAHTPALQVFHRNGREGGDWVGGPKERRPLFGRSLRRAHPAL